MHKQGFVFFYFLENRFMQCRCVNNVSVMSDAALGQVLLFIIVTSAD